MSLTETLTSQSSANCADLSVQERAQESVPLNPLNPTSSFRDGENKKQKQAILGSWDAVASLWAHPGPRLSETPLAPRDRLEGLPKQET